MIICIIGGIGSGKTLTAIKEIIQNRTFAYTNFRLKGFDDYHQMLIKDVIIKQGKQKDWKVNWQFWEDARERHKRFSIYIDEIHNLIHSRRSMSKTNILMSRWVSQIRKITQDSPKNHLYIISQTLRKIDVDFRELAQVFIKCQKFEIGEEVYIINRFYETEEQLLYDTHTAKQVFRANRYFKHYDYTELIRFDDAEVYV